MKRFLMLLTTVLLVSLLILTFASCSGDEATSTAADTSEAGVDTTGAITTAVDTTPITTAPVTTEKNEENGLPIYVDGKLFIIEDGKTNYRVTFQQGANTNPSTGTVFTTAISTLRKAFKAYHPGHPLSAKTVSLTNITDDMLRGAPKPAVAVDRFLDWVGDTPLVAHNAEFVLQ